MKVYDALSGQLRNAADVQLADQLLDMKRKKPFWTVVRHIFDAWKSSQPSQYDSFLFDVKSKRDSRATRFGSNKNLSLRYTIDIPSKVYMLIRILYPVEELRMDKKFLREFARRFPECRIAERI